MPTFSASRHTTSSSQKRFPLSQVALAVLSAFGSLTTAAVDLRPVGPTELPQGGQIAAGKGAINVSGNTMDIQQQSQKLIANWQSFNIGSQGTVNFVQPGASAMALNRIVGQDPTQIYGRLNANGQVFLVNPNGVLFGRSASVNVGGLTASTLNITDENFLAGRYLFERNGAKGKVENLGALTAADGGYLALLAPEVRNEGALIARMGTVAMAAGDKITLEFSGSRLTSLTADAATIATLIDNQNLVDVGGGQVIISTAAANQLLGATVNNEGIVSASSLTAEGGRVVLRGDLVRNIGEVRADGAGPGGRIEIAGDSIYTAGRISADGSKGGDIRVTGNDLTTGGVLSAVGSSGSGGQVLVAAAKDLWQTQSTQIKASGVSGGTVTIDGGQQLVSSASIQSDGSAGAGGAIRVTADFVQLLSANLQANGETAGGQVRIGGEWQGGKGAAVDEVRNAQVVAINDTTRLSAKANSGTGGEVVVWSDQRTTMLGQAEASGAAGKGGRIEVSSAGELTTTARLNAGSGGQVLLDPKNLIIDDINSTETTATQYDLAFRVEGGNLLVRNINGLAWGGTADAQPSVALSQPTGKLVIGSPKEDTAYIYHIDPDNPSVARGATLLNRLNPTTNGVIQSDSAFGTSVAIDRAGQYVAVGAPNDTYQSRFIFDNGVGAAFLWNLSGTQPLVPQAFVPSSVGVGGNFGLSVALSGDGQSPRRLFVSSSEGETRYLRGSGKIYLYEERPDGVMPPSATRIIHLGSSSHVNVGPYIAADSSGNIFYNWERELTPVMIDESQTRRISPPYDPLLPSSSFGQTMTVCPSPSTHGSCGPLGISGDGKYLFIGRYPTNSGIPDPNLEIMQFSSGFPVPLFGIGYFDNRAHSVPNGVPNYTRVSGVAAGEGGSPLIAISWSSSLSGSYGGNVVSLFRLNPGTGETPPSVTSQRFIDNPSETNVISPTAVRNLLATGASLTLQANNDLTVNKPVMVNNPSGNGGDLTLQAGRSVLVNASITTDNGNLNIVANETNANGVIAVTPGGELLRSTGAAVIAMANGTTLDAGTGRVGMTIASGAGRSGSAAESGDITLGTITAGRITAVNAGPSGGNIVLLPNAKLTASGSGDALVLAAASGGNFINNGGPQSVSASNANGRWLVYSKDPDKDTFGGLASGRLPFWNRTYSVNPPETVALAGNRYLFSDQHTLNVTYGVNGQSVTRQYDGTFVGAGQLSGSVQSFATVNGLVTETHGGAFLPATKEDKEVLSGLDSTVQLQGGPYRNAGTYPVGYTVSGQEPTSPTGYRVVTSGEATGSVLLTITPAPLTIGINPVTKIYDGTLTVKEATPVDVTVATPPVVCPAGVACTRYGDTFIAGTGTFTYTDKNVAYTNNGAAVADTKEVTVSGVQVNDGNNGNNYIRDKNGNYSYSSNTRSTITQARLDITTNIVEKIYDGTRKAPQNAKVSTVSPLYGGELTRANIEFTDPDAGQKKDLRVSNVKVTDLLTGKDESKNFDLKPEYLIPEKGVIKQEQLMVSTADVKKIYDGTLTANEANGAKPILVSGHLYTNEKTKETAVLSGGRFEYTDKNAGDKKTVNVTDVIWNDHTNYQLILQPNTTSVITKAPLTINLAETQCRVEDQKDPFQYSFTGFKNAETAELVVNGTPTFTLDSGSLRAGAAQPLQMTGTGTLSATNYEYVIGRSDAVVDVFPGAALTYTIRSQSDTALRDASSTEAAQAAVTFVADKTNNARFVSPESVNVSKLAGNGAAFVNYVGARYADRQERFSSAISMLETNPSLADLAQCKPGDAPETLCIPAVGTPQFGANPSAEIQRKVAYLFANQAYDQKKGVEPLSTPYSDTEAIGKILQDNYGYEVNIVRDATRRDLILTLKKAAEAHARDESVLLYYAGHGIELRDRQSGDMMGYWIPVDANTRDPRTWVSNADIGKFMQLLPAKQVMLVSDSCFSGRLAVERKIEKGDVETRRAQLLAKRAVTVMSSGNFEEVDDAGKGDHSIFAWSLIEQLNASVQQDKLVEGNDLFTAVRARIHAEQFPQTPQYSALLSSGYEPGGDFFLERR